VARQQGRFAWEATTSREGVFRVQKGEVVDRSRQKTRNRSGWIPSYTLKRKVKGAALGTRVQKREVFQEAIVGYIVTLFGRKVLVRPQFEVVSRSVVVRSQNSSPAEGIGNRRDVTTTGAEISSKGMLLGGTGL